MRRLFVLLVATTGFTLCSFLPAVSTPFTTDPASSKPVGGVLTKNNFQDSVRTLYEHLGLKKAGLSFEAFSYGIVG